MELRTAELEQRPEQRSSQFAGGHSVATPATNAGQGHQKSLSRSAPARIFSVPDYMRFIPTKLDDPYSDRTDRTSQSATSVHDVLSPRPRSYTSIPIQLVDSTLDGIWLKSTALPPEVLERISSQSVPASNGYRRLSQASPSPPHRNAASAGHTPMPITTSASAASNSPQDIDIPADELPVAPQHTRRQIYPLDSDLSQLDDDPALQGPLSLQNDRELDDEFLQELNQKLANEASRPRSGSDGSGSEFSPPRTLEPEPIPGVRLKNSTNFGTPYGTSRCGIS